MAHVAMHARDAAIVAASDRPVTFGGARAVTIAAGAQVSSDPIALGAAAGGDVVVSLYFAGTVDVATEHFDAAQTSYVSTAGDFGAAVDLAGALTMRSWYVLTGVDVDAPADAKAIVAVGDSLTDGRASTPDANHRWPDFLAARLNARPAGAPRAVVNAGIS
ncbi:MAG TPA: SGNH/GDSL hydrolase family protein, partial [Polyangia bacterium]|nr:SGNH/GDSL hydrolase family protein [Polyangia bacterium]